MSATPTLDELANGINEKLDNANKLDRQADDLRLNAGRDLIAARCRVESGETELSWTSWCRVNIKRSVRDIRRLMAMAGADDPVQAREDEKARNRAAKPAGSRAASVLQAHNEGVKAFPRLYAAWRKGWKETKERTGASPRVAPAPFVQDEGVHRSSKSKNTIRTSVESANDSQARPKSAEIAFVNERISKAFWDTLQRRQEAVCGIRMLKGEPMIIRIREGTTMRLRPFPFRISAAGKWVRRSAEP